MQPEDLQIERFPSGPENGTGASWLQVGARVRPRDRGNVGEIVAIDGDAVDVHFVSPEGTEATKTFSCEELAPLWEAEPPAVGEMREAHGLPEIYADDGDLRAVTEAAWDALQRSNQPPWLFRCAGLARVERGDSGALEVVHVDVDRMRHALARVAFWYTLRKGEDGSDVVRPKPPPLHVVRDVLATPNPPAPVLTRIVAAPILAPDGGIMLEPGYHAAARVYYDARDGLEVLPVSDSPTPADVARARELVVTELLGDFPFLGPADRAAAVGLYLLPFVRELIPGPTPLHLVEKPTPGTGAGLMVSCLSIPALGSEATVMTEGTDEEEWRKRITATLRKGPSLALIDNLRRRLDSAAVSAVLTAPTWGDRILGKSETVALAVRCGWIATANNVAVSTEIARRSIPIRLDAKMDRPWQRERAGFRHPDLAQWTRAHRGELVWAALTLARAWIAAGRPRERTVTLGSFEEWADTIGGILGNAGVPGFLDNLPTFYERADAEGEQLRAFVGNWWDTFHDTAVGVRELFAMANERGLDLALGDGKERSQQTRLGKLLRQLRDRRYGTLKVEAAGKLQRAQQWRLVETAGERCEPGERFPLSVDDENISPLSRAGGNVHNVHNVHSEPGDGGGRPDLNGERDWAEGEL